MKHLFSTILCATLLFSTPLFAASVNVNSASAAQIAKALSGVGDKKAQAIVKYRKKNGRFTSVKDLLNVKGIGPSIIKNNKKDIKLK